MRPLTRLYPLWFLLFAAGRGQSTASLEGELKSSDPLARLHAVHTLEARTGEAATAVPALTDALKDEDAYVCRDAGWALGQFGPKAKEAAPSLRALLQDKEPSVRRAADQALQKIEPDAAAPGPAP